MAVIRFEVFDAFEAAAEAGESELSRFTVTPYLAAEWLGLSRRAVHQLVSTGVLDAVIVGTGHVFLDPAQLEDYAKRMRLAHKKRGSTSYAGGTAANI